jgi:calmodulin
VKGGSVDVKKQLGMLTRAVGLNPTEAELADWRKAAGSSLDEDAFKAFCKKKFQDSDDTVDEIVDAFSVFDKDGEGMISAVEFKHILSTMGEKLSEKDLKEVMKEVTIDSKGMINYKDFSVEIFGES